MALEKLCDLGEAARPALLELMKATDVDFRQEVLDAMQEKHIAPPSKESMVTAWPLNDLAGKDRRLRLAAVVILARSAPTPPRR